MVLIHLTITQNPDGGFGFFQGNESNVYMTAIVLQTFNVLSSIFNVIDFEVMIESSDIK